jgi:hypothetical protein
MHEHLSEHLHIFSLFERGLCVLLVFVVQNHKLAEHAVGVWCEIVLRADVVQRPKDLEVPFDLFFAQFGFQVSDEQAAVSFERSSLSPPYSERIQAPWKSWRVADQRIQSAFGPASFLKTDESVGMFLRLLENNKTLQLAKFLEQCGHVFLQLRRLQIGRNVSEVDVSLRGGAGVFYRDFDFLLVQQSSVKTNRSVHCLF